MRATPSARISSGPAVNPLLKEPEDLKLPFSITIKDDDRARSSRSTARNTSCEGTYTRRLASGRAFAFQRSGMKVNGLCKFLLLSTGPEFELYVTPINIDPKHPAMPVGYPSVYSVYLAKNQGPFATLGLAEDTWALNEHIISDDQFIRQCLDMDREREEMFFDAIDKVPHGLITCVFDGTDRLQHTFWRDIDERHPARPDQDVLDTRNVIEDLYTRMDDLVGKTMARCQDKNTLLMVISDHGFGPFRRGVDLNRWLEENGYLVLHDGRRDLEHLAGIDWSRTRAFAIGLAGIYINIKDKYSQGIVDPAGEVGRLRQEIADRLNALVDTESGASAVKRVYIAAKFYKGPYRENGPDLIVGYQRGYRVSWETAIGRTTTDVFHSNKKAWSGDHCVDPSLVPGILFCNRHVENQNARLIDIGPTVLSMFGVDVPEYMDGKALIVGDASVRAAHKREETLGKGGLMANPSTRKVSRRNLLQGTAVGAESEPPGWAPGITGSAAAAMSRGAWGRR